MFRLLALACLPGVLPCSHLPRMAPRKAPRPAPALTLVPTPPPRQRVRGDQEFIFRGSGGGPVHRAGPEHFRLTQAADGKPVRLAVAYDRERLAEQEERTGTPRVVKKVRALRAR